MYHQQRSDHKQQVNVVSLQLITSGKRTNIENRCSVPSLCRTATKTRPDIVLQTGQKGHCPRSFALYQNLITQGLKPYTRAWLHNVAEPDCSMLYALIIALYQNMNAKGLMSYTRTWLLNVECLIPKSVYAQGLMLYTRTWLFNNVCLILNFDCLIYKSDTMDLKQTYFW